MANTDKGDGDQSCDRNRVMLTYTDLLLELRLMNAKASDCAAIIGEMRPEAKKIMADFYRAKQAPINN